MRRLVFYFRPPLKYYPKTKSTSWHGVLGNLGRAFQELPRLRGILRVGTSVLLSGMLLRDGHCKGWFGDGWALVVGPPRKLCGIICRILGVGIPGIEAVSRSNVAPGLVLLPAIKVRSENLFGIPLLKIAYALGCSGRERELCKVRGPWKLKDCFFGLG